MKQLAISIAAILMATLLWGCVASKPPLSSLQLRKMTTRVIESNYEDVFRATMTVLQDDDFVIKNTDMNSGLIAANFDRERPEGWVVWDVLLGNTISKEHIKLEVSATVNTLREQSQELRIIIQETRYSSSGDRIDITQGLDPEAYKKLFDDISLEVKRRETTSKRTLEQF